MQRARARGQNHLGTVLGDNGRSRIIGIRTGVKRDWKRPEKPRVRGQ